MKHILTFALIVFVVSSASATTLVSNLRSTPLTGSVQMIPELRHAFGFSTTSQPFEVSSITLRLWGTRAEGLTLSIYDSVDGLPNAPIQTFDTPFISDDLDALYQFSSTSYLRLDAQTQYFVHAEVPSGQINWHQSEEPFVSNGSDNFFFLEKDIFNNEWYAPFSAPGEPSFFGGITIEGSSVPEPNSVILFLVAASLISLVAFRKCKANKALQPTPSRFALRGCADPLLAVDHQ